MTMKGLFHLQSAHELLAKLRHDYGRLREAPNDSYVAFDFFANAEHLLDWVYPGSLGRASRTAERDSHLILQVVSQLATGAKHMVPDGSSHLVVNLEGAAAAELGLAVTPLKLATRVLQYWEDHSHFT